ncbi:MAG: hypothetical protein ACYTAS_21270, partial [Planctomycetota bacterium]
DLPGVYEADVEGLGTVLAFRVEPAQASLYAEVYRGPDNEQIKKTWQLPESPVRLFALGQERHFANPRFLTSITMPAIVEIIPLSEEDVGKLIEVNRFGVGKIVDPQIADSLMPEMMMEQMGLPAGLGMDSEIAESMGVHDMAEPPALQFTCINHRDSFPSPVALLDTEGRTHPLELATRRRGDGTYQASLWPSRLAGLVIEAAPTHNADVRFRNISLTTQHVTQIQIEADPGQRIEWVRSYARNVLEALTNSLKAYRKRLGGRFPDSLWGLQSYHDEDAFHWLTANVVYLGDSRRPDDARVPIAYDKALLSQGKGTYVIYSDGQLEFTGVPQLKELGMPAGRLPGAVRGPHEEFQAAEAYVAACSLGQGSREEAIRRLLSLAQRYPDTKHALAAYLHAANQADALAAETDDEEYQARRREYCREIVKRWPDVVHQHTIHARLHTHFGTPQFIESRRQTHQWLLSLTEEQKIAGIRDYTILPQGEPTDDDVRRILPSLNEYVSLTKKMLQETIPDIAPDRSTSDAAPQQSASASGGPVEFAASQHP